MSEQMKKPDPGKEPNIGHGLAFGEGHVHVEFEPDPPKKTSISGRLIQGVFAGLLAAIAVCVTQNSGEYFLPIFGGVTVLWGLGVLWENRH